jgi:hypothetical protein
MYDKKPNKNRFLSARRLNMRAFPSKFCIATMIFLVGTVLSESTAVGDPIPLFDFTGGSIHGAVGGANATVGYSFTLTSPVTVTGLGFFDVGADGLIRPHAIGLWTDSGVLLASAVVNSSSMLVPSSSSFGEWRVAGLLPSSSLTLAVGTYRVAAGYLDAQSNSEDPAIFFPSAVSSFGGQPLTVL